MPTYLPPLRLVRSFRSDFRPIPTFLQDLLSEAPCTSCPDSQGRIIELLKNVQSLEPLDAGAQGRMWFEIRYLLRRKILHDRHLFDDGRVVRNYLLAHVRTTNGSEVVDLAVTSPKAILISRLKEQARKFEPLVSPTTKAGLTLTRQTSS